jgi:hypothetical protein
MLRYTLLERRSRNTMAGKARNARVRRNRWSRLTAALLIATLGLSVAPRPASASNRGHMSSPASSLAAGHHQDHQQGGHCGQTSCMAMPGCAHAVAVVVSPVTATPTLQRATPVRTEEPVMRDLAPHCPPTPPPDR